MTTETDELTSAGEELNYDDYTHDFMGKVGNIQDFSRDFLLGLARVFEDVLNFVPYAHVKIYSEKVGINTAMDVAAHVSRAGMRQVMPMGRFIAPPPVGTGRAPSTRRSPSMFRPKTSRSRR